MLETYSFLLDGTELEFKNINGMYLRKVNDTGAVSWNIAVSSNPTQDGGKVNNRVANNREITIEFGYTMTIAPDVADSALFRYLNAAMTSNNSDIIIKKVHNGLNKYITGSIQSVNHAVYEETPVLQIVVITEPYWRGDIVQEEVYNLGQWQYQDGSVILDNSKILGEVAPIWSLYIVINRNDTPLNTQLMGINFLNVAWLQISDSIPVVYENAEIDQINEVEYIFSGIGAENKIIKRVEMGDGTYTDTNMLDKVIFSSKFVKLLNNQNARIELPDTYAPPGEPFAGYVNATLIYTPLYIR